MYPEMRKLFLRVQTVISVSQKVASNVGAHQQQLVQQEYDIIKLLRAYERFQDKFCRVIIIIIVVIQ